MANDPPATGSNFRDVQITLPTSREVAVLHVPVPMTLQDFQDLVYEISTMEKLLVWGR